jgi:hypothetical protein
MPNNSNARREKEKKKKDKKKKTDPPPLHKEDKASKDTSSRSLSLPGKDKASMDSFFLSYAGRDMSELLVPGHEQNAFVSGYSRALPVEDAMDIHRALIEAHPESQGKDQTALRRPMLLKSGLEALKNWRRNAMDLSLSPSLTQKKAN